VTNELERRHVISDLMSREKLTYDSIGHQMLTTVWYSINGY